MLVTRAAEWGPVPVARSCRALALGIADEHTSLPLVDLEMLRFPPEPLRSVGAALTQHAIVRKDEAEDRGQRADPLTTFVARMPRRMGYELGPNEASPPPRLLKPSLPRDRARPHAARRLPGFDPDGVRRDGAPRSQRCLGVHGYRRLEVAGDDRLADRRDAGRLRDHQGDREPVDGRSGVRDEPCERRGGRVVRIGMYHVASPSASLADARAEGINHFLQVAAPGAGNLIPALDIEINRVPDWMTSTQLEAWARAWLNHVTDKLGVRPMVYGSVYMFETLLGNTTWFADHGYPLWLARWGPLPSPLPANDWQGQGWTFWQWSNTGTVPGITTDVDRDRYVGTKLSRATIASLTAQPDVGGSIADASGRLACAASTSCTELFSPTDPIELTATPNPGYAFVSWAGGSARPRRA